MSDIPSTPRSSETIPFAMVLLVTVAFALGTLAMSGFSQQPALDGNLASDMTSGSLVLEKLGGYATGQFNVSAAEIAAHDPALQRLFVTNAGAGTIDVLDIHDPSLPVLLFSIDVKPFGDHANSVAVKKGVVAVAIEADPKTAPGAVVFFDTNGNLRGGVPVGSQPDMLTFTPNGRWLLVANEGEPADDYSVDPAGSVSIIRMKSNVGGITAADVVRAGFEAWDGLPPFIPSSVPAGVRISGPSPLPSQDIEPEYIAVSADSRRAYVTLQENNAVAVLDIRAGRFLELLPLGTKDHSLPGNELDVSDKDSAITLANWPVHGMFMPDAIAAFSAQGKTWLITANEGDTRDWEAFSDEARVSTLTLDPTAFPDAADLKGSKKLGRLTVSSRDGDTDGDGDFDALYVFGARSASIWSTSGELVWDGGAQLESLIADVLPGEFNCTNDANGSFDTRSDNKGPEPEGVATARLFGKSWAFLGLERVGGVVVLDVSDPHAPVLATYVNSRDFTGDAQAGTAGDLGPEGLFVIPASASPNGQPLLVVANEVSGSTAIYGISQGN